MTKTGPDWSSLYAEFAGRGHELTNFRSKGAHWVAACRHCKRRISLSKTESDGRVVDSHLYKQCTKRRATDDQTTQASL